jgi:hypothetical protein
MSRSDPASQVLQVDYLTSVLGREVELHRRLSTAFDVLKSAEQGDDPPVHFVPLAAQLVLPALAKHRNKVPYVCGARVGGCARPRSPATLPPPTHPHPRV